MTGDLEERVEALARKVERLEEIVRAQAALLGELESRRPPERQAERPPPPRPAAPPARPRAAAPPAPRPILPSSERERQSRSFRDIESLIGGNVLNKVGMLAVFLGAAYFLKLAYDNDWIGPLGRTAIGLLAGMGFVVGGERMRSKGMRAQGEVLGGGGFAILYLSLFAAFQFWHLLPQVAAFAAMSLVTAAATVLAVRSNAPAIALVGALGGFLTPALLSTGVDNQVGLFSYVLLLNLGLLAAADRRRWIFLALVALGLTEVTWVGWAGKFYAPEKWATTEVFHVAFFALFALAAHRLASLPLLIGNGLALFVGSVLNLWNEPVAFLAFLVGFNVLGAGVASARPVAFALTVAVWLGWMGDEYESPLRALTMAAACAFFATHFVTLARRLFTSGETRADLGLVFSNAAFFYGLLYALLDKDYPSLMGPLAVALAVPHFLLGQAVFRSRREARLPVYLLLGIALTFVTIAIPIQLRQHWITLAWAVEGVVLTWVGFRAESGNTRRAATIVLFLVVVRLLVYESQMLADVPFLFNRRVFVWLAGAAALWGSAYLCRRFQKVIAESERALPHAYSLVAAFLVFLLGSYEISDFFRSATLGHRYVERMSLSIFWAFYAGVLMTVGIVRDYRPIRWMAIALFGLTMGKVFLFDLSGLAQMYRVASFVVTGLLLIGASYLYQRVLGRAPSTGNR